MGNDLVSAASRSPRDLSVHRVLADPAPIPGPFDDGRVFPPLRLEHMTIERHVLAIFALTVVVVLGVLLLLYRRSLAGTIAMRLEVSRLQAAHSADQARKTLATSVLGQGYWEYCPETQTIMGDAAFFALLRQDPAAASDAKGVDIDAVLASPVIADPNSLQTFLQETLARDAPCHLDLRLCGLPFARDDSGKPEAVDCDPGQWIGLSARRTASSDGFRRYRIVGMATDISALRAAEHAASTYKVRLLDIAENIPGAVFEYVLYPDGRDALTYVNTGCERIWGVKREELLKDPSVVWSRIDPEDVATMRVSVAESASNLSHWTAEARYRMPDGRIRHLRGYGQPRRRDDGAVVWQSVMLDETAYQEMQAELAHNRAMVERSRRLETVGQMTSGIAHDFNNLLAVICGSLELVTRAPDRPDREVLISDALGAAARGATLVDQLLTFGRQSSLSPVVCDLNEIVGRTVDLLRRTLPADVSVVFADRLESPLVEIDEMMLENALLNVALNARDAMPDGGSIAFALSSQPNDGDDPEFIQLSVSDTGTGMPEDVIRHAFDPFFTTKPPGVGTGMGLSMVHGFVEQSGGSVQLRSAPGDGTTIILHLPRAPDRSDAVELGLPSATLRRHVGAARSCILVVSDRANVRDLLEHQLTTLGCRSHLASGTSDALDALASRPDIVLAITDMPMPRQLKDREPVGIVDVLRPECPIILISGDPIAPAPPEIRARRHAILRKPVGLAALSEALTTLLGAEDPVMTAPELEPSNV